MTTPCHDELVDMDLGGILLGIILGLFGIVASIPCIVKPMKLKSTWGVSPVTLVMANFQMTAMAVNAIVLKWPQVRLCSERPLGCQPSLISLYMSVLFTVLLFPQHLLCVYYPSPPEAGPFNRKMWYLQLVVCGVALVVAVVWSSVTECKTSGALQAFGQGAAVFNTVFTLMRYLPQIYITIKNGASGSVSYLSCVLLCINGCIIAYNTAVISEENISTWGPSFAGTIFTFLILILCFLYDYVLPRRDHQKEHADRHHVKTMTCSIPENSPTSRQPFDASGGYTVTPAAVLESAGRKLKRSATGLLTSARRTTPTSAGLLVEDADCRDTSLQPRA